MPLSLDSAILIFTFHNIISLFGNVVGYLTPDSDLDLAPDPDQFGALPPVSCSEVVRI